MSHFFPARAATATTTAAPTPLKMQITFEIDASSSASSPKPEVVVPLSDTVFIISCTEWSVRRSTAECVADLAVARIDRALLSECEGERVSLRGLWPGAHVQETKSFESKPVLSCG